MHGARSLAREASTGRSAGGALDVHGARSLVRDYVYVCVGRGYGDGYGGGTG